MRVEESKQRDVGKRRARIGHNAMDYLHVAPGDIVELPHYCNHATSNAGFTPKMLVQCLGIKK